MGAARVGRGSFCRMRGRSRGPARWRWRGRGQRRCARRPLLVSQSPSDALDFLRGRLSVVGRSVIGVARSMGVARVGRGSFCKMRGRSRGPARWRGRGQRKCARAPSGSTGRRVLLTHSTSCAVGYRCGAGGYRCGAVGHRCGAVDGPGARWTRLLLAAAQPGARSGAMARPRSARTRSRGRPGARVSKRASPAAALPQPPCRSRPPQPLRHGEFLRGPPAAAPPGSARASSLAPPPPPLPRRSRNPAPRRGRSARRRGLAALRSAKFCRAPGRPRAPQSSMDCCPRAASISRSTSFPASAVEVGSASW